MTTVAYSDGVLAADTLATWHDSRDGYVTKIAKRGPVLAAATGALAPAQAFLDWFSAGMKGEPPSPGERTDNRFCHGHIFAPDGFYLMWGPDGWERSRNDFYTMGSGGEYAAGALAAGADAVEAVRIAIRFDTKSGGAINVLRRKA